MIGCPLLLFTSFANFHDVHVLFCMDDHLYGPTAVVLTSMFENANRSTFYHVHIQVPGFFKSEIKIKMVSLKMKHKNCEIEFIDMGDTFHDFSGRFPHCALYYLLAANLFPHFRKLIYLDGDIIVRHDLYQLYSTNIDDYYVAGVRDPLEISWGFGKAKKKVKMLKIPDLKQYINSGVLLLNLKKIRDDQVEERFVKFMEKEKENIVNEKFYGDQDIINPICYGMIFILPIKFNAMVNMIDFKKPFEKNRHAKEYSTRKDWEEVYDPIIVHFAAGPKPWTNQHKTKYHKEWMVYSKNTKLRTKGGNKPQHKKKPSKTNSLSKM